MEKDLKIRISIDKKTGQLKVIGKEFDDINNKVNRAGKSTKRFSKNLLGLAASAVSIYAVNEAVSATVNEFIELENAQIGVKKTTGLAKEEFNELTSSLDNMAVTMNGFELRGIYDIAEAAGQLGIKGVEDISEFTRVIGMVELTTELSAAASATSFAKLSHSLNEPISKVETLASVANELSNNTSATVGNLLKFSQRLSGGAKTAGLLTDEIFGLSATMTDLAINFETGGTNINRVMLDIVSDSDKFAEAIGADSKSYADAVQNEPIVALQQLLEHMSSLGKTDAANFLKDLGYSGTEVKDVLLKLSSNTQLLTKNLKIAHDEYKIGTSIQLEYETAAQGLQAQNTKLSASFELVGSDIGEYFKEPIIEASGLLIELTQGIRNFIEESQKPNKFTLIKDIEEESRGLDILESRLTQIARSEDTWWNKTFGTSKEDAISNLTNEIEEQKRKLDESTQTWIKYYSVVDKTSSEWASNIKKLASTNLSFAGYGSESETPNSGSSKALKDLLATIKAQDEATAALNTYNAEVQNNYESYVAITGTGYDVWLQDTNNKIITMASSGTLTFEQLQEAFDTMKASFEKDLTITGLDDTSNSMTSILDAQIALAESGQDWASSLEGQAGNIANISKEIQKAAVLNMKYKKEDIELQNTYAKEFLKANGNIAEEKKVEERFDKDRAVLNEQRTNAEIAGYANLAGSMSQAFAEGTAGAEAFKLVQQGLSLYHGVTAILAAWSLGYPQNIPAVIATTAAVVPLLSEIGTSLSGSGSGSGSGVNTSITDAKTFEELNIAAQADSKIEFNEFQQGLDSAVAGLEKIGNVGSALSGEVNSLVSQWQRELLKAESKREDAASYSVDGGDALDYGKTTFDDYWKKFSSFDIFSKPPSRSDIENEIKAEMENEALAFEAAALEYWNSLMVTLEDNISDYIDYSSMGTGELLKITSNLNEEEALLAKARMEDISLLVKSGRSIEDFADELKNTEDANGNLKTGLIATIAAYDDYIGAVDEYNDRMKESADNQAEWNQRNETTQETAQRLAREIGFNLAGSMADLNSIVNNLSSDVDGLTDAELEAVQANDAYLQSILDTRDSLTRELALLKSTDPTENLALQRAYEMADITDETNRLLLLQIYAEEDRQRAMQESQEAYRISLNEQSTALNTYLSDVSSSISGLEGVLDSLGSVIDGLRGSAIGSSYTLARYKASMIETQALSLTDDYDAYQKSLSETISLSSILNNLSAFNGSRADQGYALLSAANEFEALEIQTDEEIDYLRKIEVNTRESIAATLAIIETLGGQIDDVYTPIDPTAPPPTPTTNYEDLANQAFQDVLGRETLTQHGLDTWTRQARNLSYEELREKIAFDSVRYRGGDIAGYSGEDLYGDRLDGIAYLESIGVTPPNMPGLNSLTQGEYDYLIGAGLWQQHSSIYGFRNGGYTYNEEGIVHPREFVLNRETTSMLGINDSSDTGVFGQMVTKMEAQSNMLEKQGNLIVANNHDYDLVNIQPIIELESIKNNQDSILKELKKLNENTKQIKDYQKDTLLLAANQ